MRLIIFFHLANSYCVDYLWIFSISSNSLKIFMCIIIILWLFKDSSGHLKVKFVWQLKIEKRHSLWLTLEVDFVGTWVSLQLVAGVPSDKDVWAGSCTLEGGCVSGLFGKIWLLGVLVCGAQSLSGCTVGGTMDILALSKLFESAGFWLARGMEDVGWNLSEAKADGGELLALPLSGVEAWTSGKVSWSRSGTSRGDGVVEMSPWIWEGSETCWADSARANANMRAAFLGAGGGWVVVVVAVEIVDLTAQGVSSFKQFADTIPIGTYRIGRIK